MRRLAVAIAVTFGLVLAGGVVTVPNEAECAYCPTYPCYGPCGTGCVCLKKGNELAGECFSAERAPGLLETGWSQL